MRVILDCWAHNSFRAAIANRAKSNRLNKLEHAESLRQVKSPNTVARVAKLVDARDLSVNLSTWMVTSIVNGVKFGETSFRADVAIPS